MAGRLMVIVTRTPCSVILNFVVDCQVFSLMLRIHLTITPKKTNYQLDYSPDLRFILNAGFHSYKAVGRNIRLCNSFTRANFAPGLLGRVTREMSNALTNWRPRPAS